MPQSKSSTLAPAQTLPVYKSTDFLVIDGANLDDPLSFAAELLLDDVYELGKSIEPVRLALHAVSEIKFTVAEGTEIGAVGSALHLDSALTFMSPDGQITDALILVEGDDEDLRRLLLAAAHRAATPTRCRYCRALGRALGIVRRHRASRSPVPDHRSPDVNTTCRTFPRPTGTRRGH